MKTYPVDLLRESADRFQLSNPGPNSKIHKGYRRNMENIRDHFGWVLEDFEPVVNAWLSYMEPHGYINSHKDAAPWYERWQVPIQPSGTFIVDGEELTQEPGVPFRVEHWKWHEVRVGDRPRIHLVIDKDVVAHKGKGTFELA